VVKWTNLFIHETNVSTCIQYFPEDGYRESATEYLSKYLPLAGGKLDEYSLYCCIQMLIRLIHKQEND
jgi:hypothetical protein